MNIRKEINSLTAQELQRLQSALYQLQAATGEPSYESIAGLHGLPNPSYCPHGLPDFLPWHRLYILEFERALQQFEPEVSLPYWDWTSAKALAEGLPSALTQNEFTDATGTTRRNPLRNARIEFDDRWTNRNSAPDVQRLADYAAQVADAREVGVFYDSDASTDFTSALENPHGGLHTWVGGDMRLVDYAAFDPVFWLHHANVDRIWAEWQSANPDVVLPSEILAKILNYFSRPISETLVHRNLGYTYDTDPDDRRPRPPVIHVESLATLATTAKRPQRLVTLRGLPVTHNSYELRLFVNLNSGNTDLSHNNPHFAGSIYLLGMREAMNPNGFRGTFRRSLNVAPALERLGETHLESTTVRLFDEFGNEQPVSAVIRNLEIVEP